ncbi:MAG: hypothetical protein ACRECO_01855 [Xanthobacteraceae bacterium]
MPAFKCPKCRIQARYQERGRNQFTVFPENIEDEFAHCLERRERVERKESIEKFFCPALAKEASRLRNLGKR